MKPPKEETDSEIQAEWWASPGVVYFFGAGSPPKAIKIGVAAVTNKTTLEKSVIRRFKQIQTSNHETVELLGVVYFNTGKYPTRNAEILERELHIKFSQHQRFKQNTSGSEWFTPSSELKSYISEKTTKPEDIGLPTIVSQPINRNENT